MGPIFNFCVAPQSLHSAALALSAPSMSIRNKIASHPLPLPIHSNFQQYSRPVLPIPLGKF